MYLFGHCVNILFLLKGTLIEKGWWAPLSKYIVVARSLKEKGSGYSVIMYVLEYVSVHSSYEFMF